MLILYPGILVNSLVIHVSCIVDSLGFSKYTIILSVNRGNCFSFSFLVLRPFKTNKQTNLITLANTSNIQMNGDRETGHPYLVPDLIRDDFCISH